MKKILVCLVISFICVFSSCDLIWVSLNVHTEGNGSVEIDPNKSGKYKIGDKVTLTAIPEDGWVFDHWTGTIESADNPLELQLMRDYTTYANFRLINSEPDPDPDPSEYHIGDTGPAGGLIFLDKKNYDNGWRYLEAAPYGWYNGGDDPYLEWGRYEVHIGQTLTAVGSGKENTDRIADHYGPGGYAAKVCRDIVINEFDDWFLPSKDALKMMYENLYLMGVGNFINLGYWSSSEFYEGSRCYAWYITFNNGYIQHNVGGWGKVRPVRRF